MKVSNSLRILSVGLLGFIAGYTACTFGNSKIFHPMDRTTLTAAGLDGEMALAKFSTVLETSLQALVANQFLYKLMEDGSGDALFGPNGIVANEVLAIVRQVVVDLKNEESFNEATANANEWEEKYNQSEEKNKCLEQKKEELEEIAAESISLNKEMVVLADEANARASVWEKKYYQSKNDLMSCHEKLDDFFATASAPSCSNLLPTTKDDPSSNTCQSELAACIAAREGLKWSLDFHHTVVWAQKAYSGCMEVECLAKIDLGSHNDYCAAPRFCTVPDLTPSNV